MDSDKQIKMFAIQSFTIEQFVSLIIHSRFMIYHIFSASGLAADLSGHCIIRLALSYLLIGALFERNQFLSQKPINVIDCIKVVDGEVRVPRVDSLKRHVLERFQKANSSEFSILKDI